MTAANDKAHLSARTAGINMNKHVKPSRLAFFYILTALAAASSTAAQTTEVTGRIDEYLRSEMTRQRIPGLSLAVIKDGKPLVVKGYGLSNIEHQVAVKPETIFQSGSMGKQFTSTAVMLLVEEGKIGLDDKISRYVGAVPPAWRSITVRQVLNHISGMPNDFTDEDYQKDWTEDQLLAKAKAMPLVFAPGTSWAYSNVGYVVLGIMVSKVSGKFYGDFLQERVFKPLGMTTTRIISEADIIPNRAAGYRLVKGELKNQEWVAPMMNTTADGSLYWSILDLVKWDEALTKGRVLKPESWAAAYTPARLATGSTYPYGFGWALATVNGQKVIEHSGAWQGFTTDISRYIDNKLTVIVLTNLAGASPVKISHAVAEIVDPGLIERPIKDMAEATTTAHRKLLESFATETIDRSVFTDEALKSLLPRIIAGRDRYRSLGEMQSIEVLLRMPEGNDAHHRYLAKFKNGALVYNVWTNKEAKITAIRIDVK